MSWRALLASHSIPRFFGWQNNGPTRRPHRAVTGRAWRPSLPSHAHSRGGCPRVVRGQAFGHTARVGVVVLLRRRPAGRRQGSVGGDAPHTALDFELRQGRRGVFVRLPREPGADATDGARHAAVRWQGERGRRPDGVGTVRVADTAQHNPVHGTAHHSHRRCRSERLRAVGPQRRALRHCPHLRRSRTSCPTAAATDAAADRHRLADCLCRRCRRRPRHRHRPPRLRVHPPHFQHARPHPRGVRTRRALLRL